MFNTLLFQLTSMQKAYHDLKEQALRMSIEQDAQKNQIEAEINKLKVSNQELINKSQVRTSYRNTLLGQFSSSSFERLMCCQTVLWI